MRADHREPSAAITRIQNLTVADHTFVVSAVLASSLDIAESLARSDAIRTRRPLAISDAALLAAQCDSIDKQARNILDDVAIVSPLLRLSNPRVSGDASREVMQIALATASIDDLQALQQYLESALAKEAITDSAILAGVSTSLEILQDGASTIYDAGYIYSTVTYSSKKSAKEDAKDLGKADVAGAIVGALGGAAAGGVTAPAGALVGGIGASTAKAVEKVVDSIIDWIW